MIYVDGATQYPDEMTRGVPARLRTAKWCHMVSDTSEEELHAFAASLGLKRQWAQLRPKSSAAHYDLTATKRALAVKLGAVEITSRELVRVNFDGLTRRRERGELP